MAELGVDFLRANLAAALAVVLVAAVRGPARRMFGARAAYGLWLLPALAFAVLFLPGPTRTVTVTAVQAVAATAAPLAMPDLVLPSLAPAPAVAAGPSLDQILGGLWALGALAALVLTGLAQRRSEADVRQGLLGPAVIGVVVPRIVLPDDFTSRYSLQEQALVLAHERAHLARQDARINALVVLGQCINWFNPLVHLGAYLLRIDQELACDEVVIASFPSARPDYAQALVKAQLAIRPLPLGCYWPSGTEHPLVERLAMINQDLAGRARRLAGASAVVLLCAGAGYAAWAAQPARIVAVTAPATRVATPAISAPTVKDTLPATVVLAQANPAQSATERPCVAANCVQSAAPAALTPLVSARELGAILQRECLPVPTAENRAAMAAIGDIMRGAAGRSRTPAEDAALLALRPKASVRIDFSNNPVDCVARTRLAVRPPQQSAAIAEALRTNNLAALIAAGGDYSEVRQVMPALCGQLPCGREPEDAGGLWMVGAGYTEVLNHGQYGGGAVTRTDGAKAIVGLVWPASVEVRLQCAVSEEDRLTGCRPTSKNPAVSGYLDRALDLADRFILERSSAGRAAPTKIALTVYFYPGDGLTSTWAPVS